ncbi:MULTISPECIES: type VI secretion system Vgr family protein [Providencia]|uniref:Type VI secretion system tip protein VgrG n=3 Tax=Providencia TaxID=586 RepID=A0AAI9MWK5_PROST|nr:MULTISPECIES: type VI secretion system Vgr family protein [Providencia]ELR5045365.1 type VI secretion system tip protein VgrG [Providencia rettgeri]ELR5035517.1 type VI secretion system tip protein VgrG [Providencia stuartii]ELR5291892.1 type VI secretion system tip protein VgrG [Providencia stuartii]MCR4179663.1 type VI secretion system tip protein VgrG [Providencia vermicola]URE77577.1 type VI secretion system tip protein VgrG [Providencia stuartii]
MSLLDTVKNLQQGQNRYRLEVQGCNELLDVEHFTGREAASDTYRYQITFTCSAQDLSAQQFLRRNANLTFSAPMSNLMGLATQPSVAKRVHGVVTDFRRLSGSADEARYQLVIEPFFALLRHQIRSHRFFINQSIPDVVEQILREHNFKGWEFEFNLEKTYPKREQINQINESDRQFIERLLSEVGIFYRFGLQDETQTEVLHFTDSQRGYVYDKTLPLNSPSGLSDNHVDSVWGLSLRHQVVESTVFAKDYNHRLAEDTLISAVADMTHGDGEKTNYGDVYHYKGRHLTRGDKIHPETETANFWARLDHERFLARQTLLRGESSAADLTPLLVLNIQDNSLTSTLPTVFKSPILITRLRFTASRDKALTVRFDAVPYTESLCWRPALKPRPVIAGTLMARVTSAKDHDIYAHQNEHGFYWVKFDADRDEKTKGYESMPVRLAKPYAGDTYGMHFPLIQGTEVAIAFHEGDPDRPYIAHALHDSRHPDHVTDKNNTRNVIRTPANNKLRMEDKRGQEHIKLSTEYAGKTQLNLGHLVNAEREQRGDGFELRTDSWGAIRAGKGLFITTDKQDKAGGEVLAMGEAIAQLKQAQQLTESLKEAANVAKAELADLQAQKDLLSETLNELKQSALLVSSPAGIAHTTPKSIQTSAGENIINTARQSADFSIAKKFTVAAGEIISLFAQKLGIKIFANQGKIAIEAQHDEMSLDSLKDLSISSHDGKVIIKAKKEIILTSGGGYIRIADGTVECAAPDKIIERGAVWQKFGGQSISEAMQSWESSEFAVKPQLVNLGDLGSPHQPKPVGIYAEGTKSTSTSDAQGNLSERKGLGLDQLDIKLDDK